MFSDQTTRYEPGRRRAEAALWRAAKAGRFASCMDFLRFWNGQPKGWTPRV